MSRWEPDRYLRYGDERTRPATDLAAQVAVAVPRRIIDLGCGPGNSTEVLCRRWPEAHVVGLDSSPAMIASARAQYAEREWQLGSIETWAPAEPYDVVFSNAALQWVPDHDRLVKRLFGYVAAGGALAFQVPSATYARVRTLIHEIAQGGPWATRMSGALSALTLESPDFYYDCLAPSAGMVDVWETEYMHVLASPSAIVDWMSATGLRPFLDALEPGAESEEFLMRLRGRVAEAYEFRADGRVLFPFRRTFVIAYA
ncbi:MAG: methyltransferase domain-containing protein [Thermoleophilia bacterium]